VNDRVNSWRQRGAIYLWRYSDNARNYPGWHMHADEAGGLAMLELLAALATSSAVVHRTIQLSVPTPAVLAVPNNQGGQARWWAPSRWQIAFDPTLDTSSQWSFPAHDPAHLRIGPTFLSQLERGVSGLLAGEGDYSIGLRESTAPSESAELWFWW
jgi:hypothetical protein